MEKWSKYEFNDIEQLESKVNALEDNTYSAIVKVGNIVIQEADEDNDVLLSDKYLVDVMWKDIEDHPYGWKSYAVVVADGNGFHSFYGIDYQTNKF
tara:strand:+ start:1700 stop:1987 length:288 start_codon:yes stop_codon:yes gene_type:complete